MKYETDWFEWFCTVGIFLLSAIYILGCFALAGGILYVVYHFLCKYW